MRRMIAAFVLALAACAEPAPAPAPDEAPAAQSAAEDAAEDAAPPPVAAGCATQAGKDWLINGETYRLEAAAFGPDCRDAVATLIVRRPDGRPIYAVATPTSAAPLAFRARPNQEQLAEELAGWLDDQSGFFVADALPAWPQGADRPAQFQPAVSRELYVAAQEGKRPLFCYPDGAESNACVAVEPRVRTALLLGSYTPERE